MFREVFIPKATAETAATAVSALCFFSLPKDGKRPKLRDAFL